MASPARPVLEHDVAPSTKLRVRQWRSDAPRASAVPSPAAAHAPLELTWVAHGAVRYRAGAREVDAVSGDAVLVPAQVEHETTFLAPTRAAALWIDADTVAEIADAIGAPGDLAFGRVEPAGRVAALTRLLAAEVREGGAGSVLAADALSEAIAVAMLRGAPRRDRQPGAGARTCDRRVVAALDYVRAHYAEPLAVADLARAAGMSRFHFSRLFREEVGASPYRHILRTRVARAAELLRRGHCSVTEVALTVGFTDLGRFSRMFRAETGMFPAAVARSARASARAPRALADQ